MDNLLDFSLFGVALVSLVAIFALFFVSSPTGFLDFGFSDFSLHGNAVTSGVSVGQVSFWCGKINQHFNGVSWSTDSDGISGCGVDKLSYCQKFWPQTSFVNKNIPTRITGWRNIGNTGGSYASTRMTYDCLIPSTSYSVQASQSVSSSSNLFIPENSDSVINVSIISPVVSVSAQNATTYVPINQIVSIVNDSVNITNMSTNNTNISQWEIPIIVGGEDYSSIEAEFESLGQVFFRTGSIVQHTLSDGTWISDEFGQGVYNTDYMSYCKTIWPSSKAVLNITRDYTSLTNTTFLLDNNEYSGPGYVYSCSNSTGTVVGSFYTHWYKNKRLFHRMYKPVGTSDWINTYPNYPSGATCDDLWNGSISRRTSISSNFNHWTGQIPFTDTSKGYMFVCADTSFSGSVASLGKVSFYECGPGIVNQHKENGGVWTSSPVTGSGACSRNKLDYCRDYWPETAFISNGGFETITTWLDGDDNVVSTATKQTYHCVGAINNSFSN